MGNNFGKKIGSLFALILSSLLANAQCIVINEILVNGSGPCDGGCTPSTEEWVELYNTCNEPQDISCYVLTDGDFGVTFPIGTTIQAYDYLVVGSSNSGVGVDLDLATCACTSGPASQVGIFTNGSEQLAFADPSGSILDGLIWGGGQFTQTPSFTTTALNGCASVFVDLSETNPAFSSVSSQSNNSGETIYRDCDGTDAWVTGATVPTPGASNAPFIPIISTPTIVQPSCGTIASISIAVSGGIGPFTFEWIGTTNTTPVIGNLQPGDYTVAITDQGQCGTPQLYTYTITASPTDPVLVLTPTSSNICSGESTTIIASGSSNYIWNADPSLNTTTGSTVIVTPTITTTYVGNSSINGCTQTASITIFVSEYPSSSVNSNSPLCEGSALNLTATPSAGATYLWSGPNAFSSISQNPTISPATSLDSGTYTCSVALGNCVSTYTTEVIVDGATPSMIDAAGPFCITDASVDLSSPNEPGVWSGVGITDLNTGVFLPSAAGYGISAVSFDSDSYCTSPSTINIQITSTLAIPITSTPTIIQPSCGNAGSISVVISGGVGPFAYEWIGSTNTTPNIGNLQPGNYSLEVTDLGQCGAPQLFTYIISASPNDPVLLLDATSLAICIGESTTLTASGSANYIWNADPTLNTITGATVIATPTVNTTYFANASINGCSQTASITITVSSLPVSSISSNSPLCEGSTLSLTATSLVGATYLWSGPNFFSSLSQNPTIGAATPLANGTYTCNVALGNCFSTYTTVVIVDAATPSMIDAVGPFCISDAAFDLNSSNEPGVWSGMGITNTSTGLFLPSAAGGNVSALVSFDSDAYCTSPSSITIQVSSALDASINPINPLCENGNPVQLQTATAGGTWTGNAVNSSGVVNPTLLGVGNFQAIYTIAGSCGGSDMQNIQVVQLPQVNFTSSVTTGCAPLNVEFNSSVLSPTNSCTWTVDGVNVGNGCGIFNYSFQSAGCFTIGLQSTDGNGCVNSVSQTDLVCVDLFPEAAFQWTPITPSLNSPLVEFTNLSLGNTINLWEINGYLTSSTDAQFSFVEAGGSSFQACLLVSNQYGCSDSICYTIPVNREESVFVPSSFSPNNDGINDVFYPVLSGFNLNEIQYELAVFNRYGDRIFYTQDPTQAWIGNVHANEFYAQIDAYTWSLQITTSSFSDPVELTGSVVVIR